MSGFKAGQKYIKEILKVRKIELVILAGVMALSLSACAGKKDAQQETTTQQTTTQQNETQTQKETDKDSDNKKNDSDSMSIKSIEDAVVQAIGEENYLCDVEKDKTMLFARLELDESQIVEYIAKENSISSVHLDQIMIFKVKDGYADTVVDKINDDFAQTVSYVRQYPFGVAKVLNARLYKSGNYVVFVLAGADYDGDDSEAEEKLAEVEYAKIDKTMEGIFGAVPENLLVIPEDDGSNGGLMVD